MLRKGWVRDSSRESSVVASLHEQTHPAELQDQELAGLQRSAEAAWLPDDLVRSGHGLGATADGQSVLRRDPFTGTVFVFRAKRMDRLKLIYWDGSGLVMAYKRLEDTTFTWPAIKDGIMALNHAQFEALFSGLDWRKVKPVDPRPPSAPE